MAPRIRHILSTSQDSESDSERSQTREERRRVAPQRPRPTAPTTSGNPLEGVTPEQIRAIQAILADPGSAPAAEAVPAAPPTTQITITNNVLFSLCLRKKKSAYFIKIK